VSPKPACSALLWRDERAVRRRGEEGADAKGECGGRSNPRGWLRIDAMVADDVVSLALFAARSSSGGDQ